MVIFRLTTIISEKHTIESLSKIKVNLINSKMNKTKKMFKDKMSMSLLTVSLSQLSHHVEVSPLVVEVRKVLLVNTHRVDENFRALSVGRLLIIIIHC